MVTFSVADGIKTLHEKYPLSSQKIYFNTSASVQYYNLLTDNMSCPAPASFINRETLLSVGLFDERFPFIEDYPMWLLVTSANYPLYYFDKDTVLYRKGESLTQTPTSWMHKLFYTSARHHFKTEVAEALKRENTLYYLAKKARYFKYDLLINLFQNKINVLSKSFNLLCDLPLNVVLNSTKRKRLPKTYFKIKE